MSYLRKNIADMTGYVPGFQPPDEAGWVKLNTNENPYPPSPKVVEAIRQATGDDLRKYPDPASLAARRAAADLYGYPVDWVIMANGSDELLNNLIRACAGEAEEIAYLHPSYSYYATLAQVQGAADFQRGLLVDVQRQGQPCTNTDQGANRPQGGPLYDEYPHDLPGGGTKGLQDRNIALLVDNHHDQGGHDVEGCDHDDEEQQPPERVLEGHQHRSEHQLHRGQVAKGRQQSVDDRPRTAQGGDEDDGVLLDVKVEHGSGDGHGGDDADEPHDEAKIEADGGQQPHTQGIAKGAGQQRHGHHAVDHVVLDQQYTQWPYCFFFLHRDRDDRFFGFDRFHRPQH